MRVTVCSLYPKEIIETKPGVIPFEYRIPPSNGIIPTILIVGDANCPLYRGSEMPTFPMVIPADQMAKAIVEDFKQAQLFYSSDAYPALFWVPAELKNGNEVIAKYASEVEIAKKAQLTWFEKLFKMAEDEWARNKQHRNITEIQRFAASSLGKTNVEWYTSPEPVAMIKCPACTTMLDASAIVCKNCKAILNPEKAKALAFAG